MKGISLKGRLSKKLLLGCAAVLVLAGGAGGYVLLSGALAHEEEAKAEASQPSGVACTSADLIKLNRGGQRWLRKYVRTDNVDGIARVRTALRIAGVLAQSEKADLYQVVVLDRAGPEGRANLRGAAIGAEVLFAPDPTKLPDMEQPFIARYADGKANAVGLFYGERKALSPEDIRTTLTAMTDRADCETLVADAGATGEEHGAPAEHGESAPEGHGAPAEGHGEAAEGHGEAGAEHGAPSETHDAPAAAGEAGHGAPPSEHAEGSAGGEQDAAAKDGWFSTVTAWIPGMGGKATHGEAPEGVEPAGDGMLSTVMRLIPGMGGDKAEAPVANADHAPETPEHGAPEQAVTVPESGHEKDAAEAEGHGVVAGNAAHAPETPEHGVPEQAATAPEAGHEQDMTKGEGHGQSADDAAHEPVAAEAKHEAAVPHGVTPEETGATH
ncbi:hypothetical protein [Rhizobium sp. 9140]|uniref:hypothetical protein n=1 Tax=Rhizobium sp. 9140 TaxID=1761900 RepID=UPI00079245F5|nr:hypothetical protein [Rhizobium sp. 9140]CZT33214.1 hypothetical protein GA0004734_00002390 [Rhizobium sp. 9140]